MCINVICDHLALQFSALVGIETDIISIAVKVQRIHIQLACGAVGRLTVKPHQRLILIFNGTAFSSRRGSCRSIGRCAFRGCCGTGGTGCTTAAARLKVIAAAKVNANVFFILVLLLQYVGMLLSLPLIVFMV